MSDVYTYTLHAESREALIDLLGSIRPDLIVQHPNGPGVYPAQVTFPRAEMTAAVFDPETGEEITPSTFTGDWICEVWLTEPDEELAAICVV